MPRFENEGFNGNSGRRDVDRTVPADEDYYNYSSDNVDLNFNSKSHDDDIVVDNQQKRSVSNQGERHSFGGDGNFDYSFKSETADDYDTGRPGGKRSGGSGASGRNVASSRRDGRPQSKSSKAGKKKKASKAKRIICVILALILILCASVVPVLARVNYDDKKADEYVSSSELQSSSSVKNILLLGVDARSDDEASASRSDTMMLVSVDSKHHSVKLVSFLRDTWLYIPSIGYEQRLNAACSNGGYKNVVETIEYNFKIDIDSYVVTDFEMFKVLVDSIGGVKVDVTEKEAKEVTNHPKRYGDVTLESGEQTLTGEQALAYCRIRKIDTDFVRTQRQRTVMSAILKKAVANPFKLYKMAYNSAPYLETDMTKGELISFVSKAALCVTSIYQTSVPFDGTWDYATIGGNSVITINKEKNCEKLSDYLYNLSNKEIKALESDD